MIIYKLLVENIVNNGCAQESNKWVKTRNCSGFMLKHNMLNGFPLITTNYTDLQNVCAQLHTSINKCSRLSIVINELKSKRVRKKLLCVNNFQPGFYVRSYPSNHLFWQVTVTTNKSGHSVLNMHWSLGLVDAIIELPDAIASYAFLLLLLCKDANMIPGYTTGFLADAYIQTDHLDKAEHILKREPFELSKVLPTNTGLLLDWKCAEYTINSYKYHPKLI